MKRINVNKREGLQSFPSSLFPPLLPTFSFPFLLPPLSLSLSYFSTSPFPICLSLSLLSSPFPSPFYHLFLFLPPFSFSNFIFPSLFHSLSFPSPSTSPFLSHSSFYFSPPLSPFLSISQWEGSRKDSHCPPLPS